jgi:peptidoglycan hydrolase CwlO-like protein
MKKIFYLLFFTLFIISCNKSDIKKINNKIDSLENLEYRIQDLELENKNLKRKINSLETDLIFLQSDVNSVKNDLSSHEFFDH